MRGCIRDTKEVGNLTADRKPSAENYYEYNLRRVQEWHVQLSKGESKGELIIIL
jgi:hypothetical protein